MAFNEQGEIIRQLTGSVDDHGLTPPDDPTDGGFWGCGLLIVFIIFLMFGSFKTCTPSSDDYSASTYKTITEKINPYGVGYGKITFWKSISDSADIQVTIDRTTSRTLSVSASINDVNCDGTDNISFVLTTGYHFLYATNNLGKYCSFQFYIKEGECKIQELELKPFESKQIEAKLGKIMNGDWFGTAFQYDAGHMWNVWNVLLSCKNSTNEYKINYPSLGCTGTWIIDDVSGNIIYFKEHILFGKAACTDLMEVDVKIINNWKIEADYYSNGQTLITKVILRKL